MKENELVDMFQDFEKVREQIVYFGEGHFKTREELRAIVTAAAEDFVSKVNKPNGKRDGKSCFTYDFGSPWDELAMYAEYIRQGEDRGWWTVCSLYIKGDELGGTAVQSVKTITDVQQIVENVLELVEELNMPEIEPEMMEVMQERLAAIDLGQVADAQQKGLVLNREEYRKAIEDGKSAALLDGYDQFLIVDGAGGFSFSRAGYGVPVDPVFDDEKILGKVVLSWDLSVRKVEYVEFDKALTLGELIERNNEKPALGEQIRNAMNSGCAGLVGSLREEKGQER